MEEISLPPRQKSASAPQLPMSTLAMTRAARKTTAHLPPTLEEISLPPQQKSASAPQLPTSTSAMTRATRTTTAHLPPMSEEISLPPWQYPPASDPGMPNPWLPTSTLVMTRAARTAAAQAKAREEHSLATTKDLVNKMLGEYTDLPFSSPDPKQNICNAINNFPTTQNFDWPNDPIKRIKQVTSTIQHALSSRIQVQTLGRGNKAQFGSISKIRL
jgi:hypothetical protein